MPAHQQKGICLLTKQDISTLVGIGHFSLWLDSYLKIPLTCATTFLILTSTKASIVH